MVWGDRQTPLKPDMAGKEQHSASVPGSRAALRTAEAAKRQQLKGAAAAACDASSVAPAEQNEHVALLQERMQSKRKPKG